MKRASIFILTLLIVLVANCRATDITDIDTLLAKKHSRFLVFPFILRAPETSWGLGGAAVYFFKTRKADTELRTSDINFISLVTLKKQVVLALGATVFFPHEKNILRLSSSYSYYPDKFWGLGNDSPAEEKEDYGLKQTFFNPQFLRKVYKNLYGGITFEYQHIIDFEYTAGSVFDKQNVAGIIAGSTSGVGGLFTWDNRNNAYSPSRGSFAEVNFTSFNKNFGSDFNFTSTSLDLRKFFPVTANTVLAFQCVIKINDGNVPYRNLAGLGGTEVMRGYNRGRFTADDLLAVQSEVRQHLFWRIGGVAFASVGEVSNYTKHFSLNGLHLAYGAGLRFMVSRKEKLNLRIDYGRSNQSSAVYVILKEAF